MTHAKSRITKSPLLWCGIGLLVAAVVLLWLWPAGTTTGLYRELLASLLGSAAVTLSIIAFVEAKHLSVALDENAKRIVDEGSQALDKKFENSFDILNQCKHNGIIAVYPPRQSEDGKGRLHYAIVAEISKTKKLDIIGISALDFFSYPRGAATQAGPYYESCRERLADSSGEHAMEIRALLLAPTSDAAEFRATAETVEGEKADIATDTATAKSGIEKLNHAAGETKVLSQFYASHPQMWAVLTDEYAFVELYHSAPTVKLCKRLKESGLPSARLEVNCTGGRVPVFQFGKRSNMYVALQTHFEHLWNYPSPAEQLPTSEDPA